MKIPLVLSLCAMLLMLGCSQPKDCGTDLRCFGEAAQICTRAKATTNYEGNDIAMEIAGKSEDKCKLRLKLITLSEEMKAQYPSAQGFVEGSTVTCYLPTEDSSIGELNRLTKNIEQLCDGPLADIGESLLREEIGEYTALMMKDKFMGG